MKLGYVDQSRDHLNDKKTVWEEVSGGLDVMKLGDKMEVNSRAYVSWFNFKGPDQQKKVGLLSGGERNRVHLAKMLKEGGNLLLLDEPTNDLDTETLSALEAALEDFAGCAVIITHDRFFLDRMATHILAFEGDSHVEWFEGNFADYEEDKKRRLGIDSTIPHRLATIGNEPVWSGVPDRTPAAERVRPVGSVEAVVNVAVPMAALCVNGWLNGELTVPVVVDGLVTVMVWQPMTSV